MKKQRLSIIGAGPGNPAYLTDEARKQLLASNEVYALNRIGGLMQTLRPDIREACLSELTAFIRNAAAGDIAVLVSGDVGFFSAAKTLLEEFSGEREIHLYCGISSLQALCAKAEVSYEEVKIVSLHGREGGILGWVSYFPKVFVLTGGSHKAHEICRQLTSLGLGRVNVIAGENLSMSKERILTGTAESLSQEEFSDLTVLLIQNPDFSPAWKPLRDTAFGRGKVPMTKEEVRWVALAALEIAPEHIVWDVGAGTGSVAIEAARKACNGMVYAVEREADALALIEENRRQLGSYNVITVWGSAPEALEALPRPDSVFVGGSGGNLNKILIEALSKNSHVRVVVSAITLETLHEAVTELENAGLSTEVTCINAARSKQVGCYHMMTANNPVYLIAGGRTAEGGISKGN